MTEEQKKNTTVQDGQLEDLCEWIEMLKSLNKGDRDRTRGYMDCLRTFSGKMTA